MSISLCIWEGNDPVPLPISFPLFSDTYTLMNNNKQKNPVTSSRIWVTIYNILQLPHKHTHKFYNFQNLLKKSIKSSVAALSRKSFQKGEVLYVRHVRAVHRWALRWRKILKAAVLHGTTHNLGSFEQNHLALATRKREHCSPAQRTVGAPRPHPSCGVGTEDMVLGFPTLHVFWAKAAAVRMEPRIIFKNEDRKPRFPRFYPAAKPSISGICPFHKRQQRSVFVLTLKKSQPCIFIQFDLKNSISNGRVLDARSYELSHFPGHPRAFCSLWRGSRRAVPSSPTSAFPFLPLGSFSPLQGPV